MNWFYWALLSDFFAGATAILAKIGIVGIDSNLATAIRTSFVLILTWIIVLAMRTPLDLQHLSTCNWLFLFLSGLATGLSWICYYKALQLGEASRVAPVDKISIVFTLVFAGLFLKEIITARHWVGALLIVVGTVIIALK